MIHNTLYNFLNLGKIFLKQHINQYQKNMDGMIKSSKMMKNLIKTINMKNLYNPLI